MQLRGCKSAWEYILKLQQPLLQIHQPSCTQIHKITSEQTHRDTEKRQSGRKRKSGRYLGYRERNIKRKRGKQKPNILCYKWDIVWEHKSWSEWSRNHPKQIRRVPAENLLISSQTTSAFSLSEDRFPSLYRKQNLGRMGSCPLRPSDGLQLDPWTYGKVVTCDPK